MFNFTPPIRQNVVYLISLVSTCTLLSACTCCSKKSDTGNAPCFAAIWQVGALYSVTGEVLENKNYQRTVKSVYLKDRNTQNAGHYPTNIGG